MNRSHLTFFAVFLALLGACAKEPPARTVSELLEDPLLLEAALVRCTQNRAETRYAEECVNAREAVKLIEAKEEANQRAAFEAQSKRKRDALRRTQRAASEARRRVREAERQRQEEEYLEQFGELPPSADDGLDGPEGNVPTAVITAPADEQPVDDSYDNLQAPASSNAPTVDLAPEPETEAEANLDSIREELRRRNEDDGSN
ncbi:MAG: EexN family lipoprotein [Gammaproteobacteria bacterium]|nr:EexN family lipoprotein [Gammaproteobacteria bacterium]